MSIWTKIAVLILVIIGVIIAIQYFSGSKPESPSESQEQNEPKTFYDVAEEDRDRLLEEPKPAEFPDEQPQQQLEEEPQPVETKKLSEPVTIYCKELSEIDEIEAERLLNVAVPGRSIGRLPMTGFNLMVQNCREIIRRWPDSWYAYRAKQMLAEMPERFRPRYKITAEELDLSKFSEPREGTKPYIVEEIN